MSTSFISPRIQGTSPIDAFIERMTRRFDANGDGTLSTDEFSSFLTRLVDPAALRSLASGDATAPSAPPAASRPTVGIMAGFSPEKMNNPAHVTFKYQIGRILQHYPNTAAGLREALPEIQQLVPGARMVGQDKLDFGEHVDPEAGRIGVIDVIQGVDGPRGGDAWQWLPVE